MIRSYHTNEAVDGKVPEALSHRLVGALTPHSQCGVYDAKVYLRPEGTLYIVRHILDFCSTLRYRKSTGLSSSSGRDSLVTHTPHIGLSS